MFNIWWVVDNGIISIYCEDGAAVHVPQKNIKSSLKCDDPGVFYVDDNVNQIRLSPDQMKQLAKL